MTPGRSAFADGAATALTVVTSLCAIVVTVFFVRRELQPRAEQRPAPLATAQPDWMAYGRTGHRIGPSDAKAIAIEFSDYQCPFCKRLEERLQAARQKYPRDFAVIYRQWPIASLHAQATNAAVASECAARQGRFEQMHELLFEVQDSLATVSWRRLATRAVIPNLAAFEQCFAGTHALGVVLRDVEEGKRLGIAGTPVLLMNGNLYRGAMPAFTLDSLIGSVLGTARGGQ